MVMGRFQYRTYFLTEDGLFQETTLDLDDI